MTTESYLGVDLGQAGDYTALCLLEKTQIPVGDPYEIDPIIETNGYGQVRITPQYHQPTEARYAVTQLLRLQLGTPYPVQARYVAELVRRVRRGGPCTLVVDRTGVGRAVVDLLRQDGLDLIAITISGGNDVAYGGDGVVVPKRDLVGAALVALQEGVLKIASSLPEAPTLLRELQAMRVTISPAGHDSYNARIGEHDDLVLALCLATWQARANDWLAHISPVGGDLVPETAASNLFRLDGDPPWRW